MTVWAIDPDGSHRIRLAPDGPRRRPELERRCDTRARETLGRHSRRRLMVDRRRRRGVQRRQASRMPAFAAPALLRTRSRLRYHLIESDGSMNVWTQSLNGEPRRRVTHDPEAASFPGVVAGRAMAGGRSEARRADAGGRGRQGRRSDRIADERSRPELAASWSPDGERITYAAERGAVWNIWEVSRKTHATRQLTHFTSPSGYVRYPSWSPNGRRIVFERETQTATIWTVQLPTTRPHTS